MKKLMVYFALALCSSTLMIACQPKDEGQKDQEVTFARQAYDRCVQGQIQDTCNLVRSSSVMSLREYYGNTANVYGGAWGVPNTTLWGQQYNADQINRYFEYLRRASKEEIMNMATQWTNTSSTIRGVYPTPYVNPTRCTSYGCF